MEDQEIYLHNENYLEDLMYQLAGYELANNETNENTTR